MGWQATNYFNVISDQPSTTDVFGNGNGGQPSTPATNVSVYGDDKNESETRVIPEIDGRLGLNYTYTFESNMALGLELGWQATNYFNVVTDQYPVTAGLFNSQFASSVGNQHYDSTSNFGLQGPYGRLQLDIA